MASRGGETGIVGAVLDGGEASTAYGRDASAGESVAHAAPKARLVLHCGPTSPAREAPGADAQDACAGKAVAEAAGGATMEGSTMLSPWMKMPETPMPLMRAPSMMAMKALAPLAWVVRR